MTLKSYLWGIRISVALAFAAWALVLNFVDPEKSGAAGLVLFYGSTFAFLIGLMVNFFTWLRGRVSKEGEDNAFVYLGVSFRQGILLALLTLCLLVLQQYRMLIWWDGALVVAGILLTELYFLTRR